MSVSLRGKSTSPAMIHAFTDIRELGGGGMSMSPSGIRGCVKWQESKLSSVFRERALLAHLEDTEPYELDGT
jgi:hypothetical protein